MLLSHRDIRKKFKNFWEKRGHKEVPPTSLVPQNDPTTLFTGSGMQQFVPNLLGEPHPLGKRLFDIQHCIRVQDIEEVGDNDHDTFFEMMGNWSLGDYFKNEQLNYLFTFLTDSVEGIGLDPKRLYVTVFAGNDQIERDNESIEIWKKIFAKAQIKAETGERIYLYDAKKNWWSRSGVPENMPPGEPGGPTSEVFYRFDDVKHDTAYGKECHPNCDCGRFIEIGNSVFMTHKKLPNGTFEELPKKNVDFGGGLERLIAASQNDPDIFKTDVFSHIIEAVEEVTKCRYNDNKVAMRIVADHIKTAVFLIKNDVYPSNKEHGYVLRRLLRRSLLKLKSLRADFQTQDVSFIARSVLLTYEKIYFDNILDDEKKVFSVIDEEIIKFDASINKGLKVIEKMKSVDAKRAFDLYQTYGFPLEITEEILKERGHKIDRKVFYEEFNKHKELSRTSSSGKFKGGLADHSEQVIRYHTATHLIHQALFDVMGDDIRQEGSNITGERLRFDFYSTKNPNEDDIKRVEEIVNKKIAEALNVNFKILPKEEAEKVGARSFFKEKYPDQVKVYFIGKNDDDIAAAYSKEFCGGPHVKNTKNIGKIKIDKFKKIGSNLYRIYAS